MSRKIYKSVVESDLDKKRKDLLSPEALAYACSSNIRRMRHADIVREAGLELPDCLLPVRSKSGEPRIPKDVVKKRKNAIAEAKAFSGVIYGMDLNKMRTRKNYLKNQVAKASKVMEGRDFVVAALDAAQEADKGASHDHDGPRQGDPEDDAHTIEYEVLPSFWEFSQDMGPDCWALIGPAGGGKSVAVIMKMLQHASTHKTARYVILRNTYRQLHDTTMQTFFDWVPRQLGKYDAAEEKFTLAGRWEFYFRSCERPEDIDKFKGIEITGYFMNEAMEMNIDVKQILDQRVGRYPMEEYVDDMGTKRKRGTSRVFRALDSNPPDQEHWLYRIFVQNPLEGHRYVLQPPYENEHNLPKDYYKKMRESYRDSPDLIARYIEGKWGAVYKGKAVYKDFDSRVHVSREPLKYAQGITVHVGMDFGLTPSCVWTQVLPNGTWQVLAELCTDNTAADEFGDAVIAYTRNFFPNADIQFYGDPSMNKRSETDARTVANIMAEKGIYLTPGEITLTSRLEAVRKRLRMRNGLVVSPTCVRLVTGFSGGYCFKRVGNTDIYTDVPEKNKYSHIHDALQYVASVIFNIGNSMREEEIIRRMEDQFAPVDSRIGY